MGGSWDRTLALGLAVAWLSTTVSDSRIFAPVREFAGRKSGFLGALLKCGYCTGFWISVALNAGFVRGGGVPGFALSVVQVAFVGAVGWAVVVSLMKAAGK